MSSNIQVTPLRARSPFRLPERGTQAAPLRTANAGDGRRRHQDGSVRTEFVEAPVFGGGRSDSLAVRGWLHDSSKIRHESLMARAEQRWAARFGAADDRSL